VKSAGRLRACGTTAMQRARLAGGNFARSALFQRICPPWMGITPLMARTSVVFPAPLGPITARISPAESVSERRSSTGRLPCDTVSC